jgi:CRISPR-associated endonuclease/helicase Cas3
MVTDLAPFDSLAQRLGRVNRYGEGDAQVHVICEPLKVPPKSEGDGGGDEEDDKPGKRKDELDHARYCARKLLDALPLRADGSRDASPVALRGLARDARLLASTPIPDIRPVDGMLFDRWACTTVTGRLPGRPPVAEWLRGKAEWEPPRTSVSWRSEVDWLTPDHLGRDTLDDFLADYPLRSREVLGDLTVRVLKHLQAIALREGAADLRAWLIRPDEPASFWLLADLLHRYDAKRNPILDGATVVLAPRAGALAQGLLDGAAEFDPKHPYDLGPKQGERAVVDTTDSLRVPSGMRLVRSIRVGLSDEDEPRWWHLCAVSKRADDEGSRSSRRELLLEDHLRRTEVWAVRLAEALGLAETERVALARAGRAHDRGKSRRVWQRSIKRYIDPPLAKGPMQPAELGGYRHELGSLHDGDFEGLAPEAKDLALHAVASHHGRARPHFPLDECFDPEVAQAHVDGIAAEVPLRFDRLQRRYGRWGLAWLESVLRAADVLGSEDDEVAE